MQMPSSTHDDLTVYYFISSLLCFSSVLVWDIRPQGERHKSQANPTRTKAHELEISYTYLDLIWTPFIRVCQVKGAYMSICIVIKHPMLAILFRAMHEWRNGNMSPKPSVDLHNYYRMQDMKTVR